MSKIDLNEKISEADNFFYNFITDLYKAIEDRLNGKRYDKEKPSTEFTFSIQLFREAVNCYFLGQYKAAAVMMRATLDAALIHSFNCYYTNELFRIGSNFKNMTSDEIKTNMDTVFKKVDGIKNKNGLINYDKLKEEIKNISVLNEEDFNSIIIIRSLGSFSAHLEEQINRNTEEVVNKLKDMTLDNLKNNKLNNESFFKDAENLSKSVFSLEIDVTQEQAFKSLAETKKYLIEIIVNSLTYIPYLFFLPSS